MLGKRKHSEGSGWLGPTLSQKLLIYGALIMLSLPAALPLIWMVSTSFKSNEQIYGSGGSGPFSLSSLMPAPWMPQNYGEALQTVPFLTYVKNTIVLCAVNVFFAVAGSAIVAYGFARLKFWGRDVMFFLMISTMALPGQVTMIPVFDLFRVLGWYGTYLPLTIPHLSGSAFFIFLLTQFFRTLPAEMSEAARLDGASDWRIFTQLVLPLSRPALATCALFQFMGTWNDFFGPLIYINDPEKYPLAYGLQQFQSLHGGKWSQLMAASTLFTLPIIILFFFAQKTFIQGISTTGGKS